MGEFADMAIDFMLSEDEYALNLDGYDEYGEPLYSPLGYIRKPQLKTYRYCGVTGLHWNKFGGMWRLFDYDKDEDEVLHM